MTRKSHITIGCLVSYLLFTYGFNLIWCVIGIVGSTFPDIDLKIGIKHRTITHSLLALFLTTLPLFVFNEDLGIVFFFNFVSHLVADSCTKMGVPLFYPYPKKYGLRFIKTGSSLEYLSIVILILFLFIIKG